MNPMNEICLFSNCIEGNPFIIRFKTRKADAIEDSLGASIEGNPFIIRFKTLSFSHALIFAYIVLKVLHL